MNNFLEVVGSWLPFTALLVPLIVGLVTKSAASSKVKSVVMIVISAVNALAYQVDAGGGILTRETAGAWLLSLVISISTYYGVWKPIDVSGAVQNIAPDKGIG